jgi:hypothetical protein
LAAAAIRLGPNSPDDPSMGIGRAVPETKRDSPSVPSFEGCHRFVTRGSFSCVLVAQSAATPDWSGGGRSFATGPSEAECFQRRARMTIAAVSTPPRPSLTCSRTLVFRWPRYVCPGWTACESPKRPSPLRSQENLSLSPSGSLEPSASNFTLSGVRPSSGRAESLATGVLGPRERRRVGRIAVVAVITCCPALPSDQDENV